ncbi:tyrosine-type recombinase/integrase [Mesorhizobium marinum]|uniref:tyrosine-type recombinase/integrase n=1 Tax=Mesorhizobium marinum TaxID=3228790 RepID=UPI003465CAB4
MRFEAARQPRDIFDEDDAAHGNWSAGTWRQVETAYRRWLGFLQSEHPEELLLLPEARITPERVRGFVEHLALSIRDTSIVINLDGLLMAARFLAPAVDYRWLASVKRRVNARARPIERLSKLRMSWETFKLGQSLMDRAMQAHPRDHLLNELQFRDGLILALLSLWPIRRRSIAALSLTKHVVRAGETLSINLFEEDTKSGRPDSFTVPSKLAPYLLHYLNCVRPRLTRMSPVDALWVSQRGKGLTPDAVYQVVRRLTHQAFGEPMALHDFRRAAATSLALEAPDKIGLATGVLQHANPDTTGRHYNLAGSTQASRRFNQAISEGIGPSRCAPARRYTKKTPPRNA